MKVLIAFASIEGQTRKIARFVEGKIAGAGHEVTMCDLSDETQIVSFDGMDRVILAASVHERRHPKPFEVMLAAREEDLSNNRTLMISVSLKAAFEDGMEEAQDYLDEMKLRTRFRPDEEALVAGAVKSGSYDYFQTQVVRHVLLSGRAYDPSDGEHEFTDWDQLATTVEAFLADGD